MSLGRSRRRALQQQPPHRLLLDGGRAGSATARSSGVTSWPSPPLETSTEVKRKVATLRLEPFGKLTKPVLKQLEAEGEALLAFVEPEVAERRVVQA